jgi:transposase InsO family protein
MVEKWSDDGMRTKQMEQTDLRFIIEWMETHPLDTKPTLEDCALVPTVRQWIRRWETLLIENGVLRLKWYQPKTDTYLVKTVIPTSVQEEVLYALHSSNDAAHASINRAWPRAKLSPWYWPSMRRDLKKFIDACTICQRVKSGQKNKTPLNISVSQATRPNQRLAMDIFGPLPPSKKSGARYVLVLVDYFSRYTKCIPMVEQTALACAQALVDFISNEGVPEEIHTDQGRQFESLLFQDLCKLMDIFKTRTTPFKPRGNGLVERFNRTMKEALTCYVMENHDQWEDYLPLIQFAYNATPRQDMPNMEPANTPFFLFKGRQAQFPADFGQKPPYGVDTPNYHSWVQEQDDLKQKAAQYMKDHFHWKMERQKKSYDLHVHHKELDVGDIVWMYRPNKVVGVTPKLSTYWDGPYVVTRKITQVLYECKKNQYTKAKVAHLDNLKKANINPDEFAWFNKVATEQPKPALTDVRSGEGVKPPTQQQRVPSGEGVTPPTPQTTPEKEVAPISTPAASKDTQHSLPKVDDAREGSPSPESSPKTDKNQTPPKKSASKVVSKKTPRSTTSPQPVTTRSGRNTKTPRRFLDLARAPEPLVQLFQMILRLPLSASLLEQP